MTHTAQPSKRYLDGAYTFISADDLASQFVEIYFELKKLDAGSTYRLYLQFNFLDSEAKKILFRFLDTLSGFCSKETSPKLKVYFLYGWDDTDMEEIGEVLVETLDSSIKLVQTDMEQLDKSLCFG